MFVLPVSFDNVTESTYNQLVDNYYKYKQTVSSLISINRIHCESLMLKSSEIKLQSNTILDLKSKIEEYKKILENTKKERNLERWALKDDIEILKVKNIKSQIKLRSKLVQFQVSKILELQQYNCLEGPLELWAQDRTDNLCYTYNNSENKHVKFDIHFPIEWACGYHPNYYDKRNNSLHKSGPFDCEKCKNVGFVNDVFIGYCNNCTQSNWPLGERGIGFVKPGVEDTGNSIDHRNSIWKTYLEGVSNDQIGLQPNVKDEAEEEDNETLCTNCGIHPHAQNPKIYSDWCEVCNTALWKSKEEEDKKDEDEDNETLCTNCGIHPYAQNPKIYSDWCEVCNKVLWKSR
jgi:hypothetical protein